MRTEESQESLKSEDPVRTAFIKMIRRVDPDDFFCPGMKGLDSMVTLDDCELKARGLGCSELKTCSAYLKKKRGDCLSSDHSKEENISEVRRD
jgi:hypothetical protein